MNLMILAAGEGTRLRPFTLQKPKPRIPFFSVPMAFYTISLFEEIPINNLVVNTFHLPEQIENLFSLIPANWKQKFFLHEHSGLLGSGGGIHNAKKYLIGGGDFFVANGDQIIFPHTFGVLKDMLQFHRWHKGIATLLVIEHPEVGHKFGGAWTNDSSRVICFAKRNPGDFASKGFHFTGVLLLSDRIFQYFKPQIEEENILYDSLTTAMNLGEEVHVFQTKAEWFETGNPEDFMNATEKCLDKILSQPSPKPYWLEFFLQTICLYSKNELFIEKDWSRVEELKTTILKVKKGEY